MSENYNEQWRNMDSDLAMRLKSLVKSYNSFIFTTNATEVFKAQVAANNESGKCYQIDLVESPAYAIPDGRKGVANFVAKAGDALVVRVEETIVVTAAVAAAAETGTTIVVATTDGTTVTTGVEEVVATTIGVEEAVATTTVGTKKLGLQMCAGMLKGIVFTLCKVCHGVNCGFFNLH